VGEHLRSARAWLLPTTLVPRTTADHRFAVPHASGGAVRGGGWARVRAKRHAVRAQTSVTLAHFAMPPKVQRKDSQSLEESSSDSYSEEIAIRQQYEEYRKAVRIAKDLYIYILRRYKICSLVKFGSSTPFEIFIACVVSIFHCGTVGPCMAPWLSTGLLVRQKGYGYFLCLKSPLPKYTATLSCVEFVVQRPLSVF
jgi:hypothetical protein